MRSTRRKIYARRGKLAATAGAGALLAGLLVGTLGTSTAQADPPAPPSAGEAETMLAGLTEEAEGSSDGYDRDKFSHWIDQGDNCNTREAVLKRDGTDVETGNDCYPTSGSWNSVYDDESVSDPSDLDIDHVVPLAEAWRSGASDWTQDRRESFANDLDTAQLLAVTASTNRSKGDSDPADWLPPSDGYHCEYARIWVWVKDTYSLTVDSAEKTALTEALGTC
ncbi:HNH endonuclease family protein [Streptomyces xiaopingdaonensis]|uniref:HNH endonuclease family protein n=1 Tax=Streptomyces xiaopingdaonensis TaxID=1565415 RepID=UPI0002D79F73|nr:HNH endonuclease family protein [Streptomyces xiaopingdaonensis]